MFYPGTNHIIFPPSVVHSFKGRERNRISWEKVFQTSYGGHEIVHNGEVSSKRGTCCLLTLCYMSEPVAVHKHKARDTLTNPPTPTRGLSGFQSGIFWIANLLMEQISTKRTTAFEEKYGRQY